MAIKAFPVTEATAATLDNVDTNSISNGTVPVMRQIVNIGDPATFAGQAAVKNIPAVEGTDYGLVTRPVNDSTHALHVIIETDNSTPIANPLPVALPSDSTIIKPTLAVTIAAYSAGNSVGGLLTVTSAMRVSGGTGVLQSVAITDHANQKAPLDIFIFESSPTGTFTDHAAAPTLAVAELVKCIGKISIAATDYSSIGGVAVAQVSPSRVVKASGSANLYAAIVTSGTPTFAATSDLGIQFGFLRD